MQRQGRRDTKPEIQLRRILHRLGLRYRVDQGVIPGSRRRHDLVFSGSKVVVEVRGCFWHACPIHGTSPAANKRWWEEKLAANVKRDADSESRLHELGWRIVVVWEHEDPLLAADRVAAAVASRS
jgi:DNA mismatch endonuclease (patch repair protein)